MITDTLEIEYNNIHVELYCLGKCMHSAGKWCTQQKIRHILYCSEHVWVQNKRD